MTPYVLRSAAFVALISPVCAQTIEEGYDSTVQVLPAGVQAVLDLPGPSVVYYDGTELVRDTGGTTTSLLTFASPPSFASFTIPLSGPGAPVLFGENSNGEIWRVPVVGAGLPELVTTIQFNYDAIRLDPTTVLVSAKTGGFASPDNDIIAVDLTDGSTDVIAVVPGFSGPLVRNNAGDVFYGTGSEIIRWDAAQIQGAFGPTQLSEGDATVVATGLPSTLDLALDQDGDFLVSDFAGPSLLEVSFDDQGNQETTTLIEYTFSVPAAGAVRYLPSGGPSAFEPFQQTGKRLSVVESQFGGGTQIRTVRPERAELTASATNPVPVGTFSLDLTGGASNALGVIAFSLSNFNGPPILLPGIEQPIAWRLGATEAAVTINLDSNGAATLPINNVGLGGTFFFTQCGFVGSDTGRTVLGASNLLVLQL